MNEILTRLTGKVVQDPKSVIEQGWVGSNVCNTGCLIKTSEVFSVCQSTVISVDKDPKDSTLCVTVRISPKSWIRYCRLSTTDARLGEQLNVSSKIGNSYKGVMRLEYCNSDLSEFPVRILSTQLYKHDPSPILFCNADLVGTF